MSARTMNASMPSRMSTTSEGRPRAERRPEERLPTRDEITAVPRRSSADCSVSVIMPALNEEGNLAAAVEGVRAALAGRCRQYEILIFDDGSTDRTGRIADTLALSCPEVRVVHNGHTRGLGYSYHRGVELAVCAHVVMVPGDNELPPESLARIVEQVGTADIVVPYFTNLSIRRRSRQILSRAFTWLVNGLFGTRLRYFNGPCIHRRSLALAALPKTSGFAYMAVMLVRLVSSGHTVTEVGVELGKRASGRSKALRLKNVFSVGLSLVALFVEIRLLRRRWAEPAPLACKR